MAQQIKLKRSAIAGKVPTTSSLDTGELAINTADGKLYFKKDDSTIQTIVTTNALVTGSLNINGPVTASFFRGDGSAVTGVVTASFALTASYAANVPQTASYALAALSASYATTASYAKNLVISGSISTVDYIDFSTTATVTQPVAGRVSWNSGDGTLDLGLDGGATTIQLGQSQAAKAYNAEATSLTKGEVVYISGSQGQRIAIKRAVATAELGSANTIGIVTETITAGAEGYILTEGQLKGLNTSAYTAGALLYLSTASGQFTQTSPAAPNHRVTVGFVERVHASAGSIYVKIDNGYEINELHNVLINGVSAGDLLVRSGSVWHNSKTLSGSYVLTGSLTATGQFIGSLNGNAATATSASQATEADLLDGQHGSYYLNASNINAGTIADAYLPGTISSDITGNAATATSASFALTASAVSQLNQNVTIVGNLTVFGTSSFTYTTSSQLAVDAAFISVNVFEPVERFGGLKVYDSGSSNATASLAWDSLHNHWVYQNSSGSTYTGGMLLSGPRNTGSLGDEPSLTKWFVPRSDGGDHLDNSQIYSSGSVTKITGSLTTSGKVNIETVDNYGSDPDKFLAIVSNEVVYRTGAQLLSDIGGQTAGTFVQNAGGGGQARYILRYEDSNSATTSSIYEDTSGRIGIRTTTPAYPLDISGSFRATSNSNIVGYVKSTSAFGATISYQDPNTSGNDWVSAGALGNSFVIATGLQVKAVVDVNGHTYPNSDKLQDFGSGSNRWRTVYTDDIDASDTVTAGALDVKSNAIVSGSLTIKGTTPVVQQGILVSGTTSLTVASISTGSYEGAFLDYVIASGSNKRAGTLATVWTPSNIEWNDVSTLDLGSTVGAEFTPALTGSNANLVLAVPTGTWTVKGHLRYM